MLRFLALVENVLAITALSLFTVFVVTGVFFRYVLDKPLSWPEEASLIAFAWLLFLGAAVCARENAHILIDLISPEPTSGIGRALEAFAALVGAIVSAIMAWVSLKYTIGAAPMVTSIFRISSVVYNTAAPVGFALVAFHLARQVFAGLRPGAGRSA